MSFIIELLHITHDDILDSIDYVGSFLRMYELINLSCDGFGRGETNRHEHSNGASMPFFFSPITQTNQNNHISDSPSINDNEFYPLSASSFFHYRG